MTGCLLTLSCLVAVAWLPIFVRFYRNWRARRNPISLSICLLISFPVYSCMFVYWVLFGIISDLLIAGTMVGANILVCVAFYLSFYLSGKRFSDERGKTQS